MTSRQKQILGLAVKEYTDTGIPVSSRGLAKKYNFSISPATLRAELSRLCESGYLVQPHTSAGRIPTDKGYRFYIKYLMEPETISRGEKTRIRKRLSKKETRLGRNIAQAISENTRSLGFYFNPDEDILYREGLSEVLQSPDFRRIQQIAHFVELVDFLEHQLVDIFDALWEEDEPAIFVGRNDVLPLHGEYSILYSGYRTRGNNYLLGALGPLRMDYARAVSIIDFIRGELER